MESMELWHSDSHIEAMDRGEDEHPTITATMPAYTHTQAAFQAPARQRVHPHNIVGMLVKTQGPASSHLFTSLQQRWMVCPEWSMHGCAWASTPAVGWCSNYRSCSATACTHTCDEQLASEALSYSIQIVFYSLSLDPEGSSISSLF